MGQQTNKIQKRRRRLNYIERKKVKAKTPLKKPVKKKPAPKKRAEPEVAAAE